MACFKPLRSTPLLALVVATLAGPVRADHLDSALVRQAPRLVEEMRRAGYKNVGILKFEVQKDDALPSRSFSEFNTGLATRLENALVLAADLRNPVGIARTSQADPSKNLFGSRYPLAWGTQSVSVDAFLTGVVHLHLNGPQKGTTTVTIRALDRKNPRPRDLMTFRIATDRSLLADTHTTFALRKATVAGLRSRQLSEQTADQEANQDASQTDASEPGTITAPDDQTTENQADFSQFLSFKVLYDGQEAAGDGLHIARPQPGQKVEFVMTAKERIAVLVRVNGLNTLKLERDRNPDQFSHWVLEPGREYRIRGFYPDTSTVNLFKVTPTEEANSEEFLAAHQYHIDLDVFTTGQATAMSEPQVLERRLTLRKTTTRSASFSEHRKKVETASRGLQVRPNRNLLLPGEAGSAQLESATFDNPIHVGHWTVMYDRDN